MSLRISATRPLRLLVCALLLAFVAACGQSAGYTRGQFHGMVFDKTQQEIEGKVGKPDQVDAADSTHPRLIYKMKTFDPENQNQTDATTTVILEKKPDGRLIAVEIIYG
jgi:hypothetical protein